MRHMVRVLIVSVLLLFLPICSFAGEIKVVDPRGLTRAVRIINAPVRVRIVLDKSEERAGCVLANIDGLARSIVGAPVENDSRSLVFEGVSDGIWRVSRTVDGRVEPVKVDSVRIDR